MNELIAVVIVLLLIALLIGIGVIGRLNAEWDIYRLERKFDRLSRRASERKQE